MRPLQFADDIGPRGPSAERIGETNVRVPKMPFHGDENGGRSDEVGRRGTAHEPCQTARLNGISVWLSSRSGSAFAAPSPR